MRGTHVSFYTKKLGGRLPDCKREKSNKIMKSKQTKTQKKAVNYEQIKETPFTYVTDDEKHYILLGDTAMHHEPFKTKNEALEYIEKPNWKTICHAMCIISKKIYDNEKNIEKTNA